MILNYGHTLAHALEAAGLASEDASPRPSFVTARPSGIGLVFAAELAQRLGRIGGGPASTSRSVVAGYGLAVDLPPGAEPATLVRYMARDKKSAGGLTFMLDGPSGVEPVHDVDADAVYEALGAIRGDR